ncbi:MAG: DUF3473 domain-containing protein [Chitinophagaceae bacterium]|nr:DUF3473 domain-containing protein [Chitinophagaceae bacterium]
MSRYVLLSFDVEEFDMPLEYGHSISPEEQFEIGSAGLAALSPVINGDDTTCTLFTTANFAGRFPDTIHQLAGIHEIASHTFYHSSFQEEDLLSSRQFLEKIAGTTVTGLRMPRMRKIAMRSVKDAGYLYDSSINPTLLPGRYDNPGEPRTVFSQNGVIRIPASVSPLLRLPLFWLAFKNYPYAFFYRLCRQCIEHDGYVCLYFHPWEFTDIHAYHLPGFVTRRCGKPMLDRLSRLIADLRRDCSFVSIRDFAATAASNS